MGRHNREHCDIPLAADWEIPTCVELGAGMHILLGACGAGAWIPLGSEMALAERTVLAGDGECNFFCVCAVGHHWGEGSSGRLWGRHRESWREGRGAA